MRSGNFGGNALVNNFFFLPVPTVERVILTQTVSVRPGENVDVGFWLGNHSSSVFGMNIDDGHTQIFIDGIGILPTSFMNFNITGGAPTDFLDLGGSFNTGARTSITVSFAINGSGSSFAGLSFDDFRFLSERPTAVPEPATLGLVGLGLLGFVSTYRRRRGASNTRG